MAARSQTLGLAALRPSRPAHRRAVSRRAEASGNSSSASEQKRELAAMRAEVQLRSMNPSQENVVSAILDLSKQEFGLHGVKFAEIMDKVNECYVFTPCQYTSGAGTDAKTVNPAGTNSGSLKTYYFAHIHGLDEDATLRLFCEHYRDVLDTPDGDSHANIRAFMVNGWDGIEFEGEPLKLRDGTEEEEPVDQV
jgi:hypothetical protein